MSVASTNTGTAADAEVRAGDLVRPTWRRLRFWIAAAVVLVLGALVVSAVTGGGSGRPLDPESPSQNGGKALARLLDGYGVPVTRVTSVGDALDERTAGSATVLVVAPDDYSGAQLERLADGGRLVLVQPARRTLSRLGVPLTPQPGASPASAPGCSDAGMTAAGRVNWTDDTVPYAPSGSVTSCYGGAVSITRDLAVLGSAEALQNQNLDRRGVAAVGVNALGADRTASRVVWLMPGTDAAGSGPVSIWDLFPAGAYRVFWWSIAVGVLVALWRGRRLGGVVGEPLPVVVRAAELVEGHGRLYLRTGARDRAAWALRRGTLTRLTSTLALPRGTAPETVVRAAAERTGRPATALGALLLGGAPGDDTHLVRIARDLAELETAVTHAVSGTSEGDR